MKKREPKAAYVFTEGQEKFLAQKLEQYCAYTERCSADVIKKLKEWKVPQQLFEEQLLSLKDNNFLNDERYGQAFARGKFRIKSWGKNKIKAALYTKAVGETNIIQALEELNTPEYLQKLHHLLDKKNASLKEEDPLKRKDKLFRFAAQKGYEAALIIDWLNQQAQKNK